ncbi:MAG TPA: GNAT family N-acetyltransferase [Flavisolibacter sp.]
MLSINFSPFPTLTTSRLLLRELTLTDAPAVQRLRSNPEVMKYINRPLTLTVEAAETWVGLIITALQNNDGITWCICLKEAPAEHIGTIGFWRIEKENCRAEIGYMLDPLLHGKGIISEALETVVRYGFSEMKLHSMEGQIDPRNIASGKVLEKAGFVREAYFRESYRLRDEFADTAVYSMLASDYKGILQEEQRESYLVS